MATTALHEKQAQFALDLLRTASKPEENVILSPVSIAVALAMTYVGAAEETKKQMNQVLFPGISDEEVHRSFSELVESLNQTKNGYQLHTANRLYAQQDYKLLESFVNQLAKHYRSELMAVDFKTQAEAVASEVNQWVAGVTMDKIQNLIAPRVLNEDTRLVLVNAIYFKGEWMQQFKKDGTYNQPFYTADGNEKEVEMMHQTSTFNYAEHDDCQVLGMPYKDNGDMLMYVILPKERNGLAALEKSMTGERLLKLINETSSTKVKVSMPKFKLEKSIELKDTLDTLGMKHMFTDKADFSNITGNKDLYVSAVIHKAFIEVDEKGSVAAADTAVVVRRKRKLHRPPSEPLVDEKGSEAAAATAVVMMTRCAMMPFPEESPPEFTADRAFLFAIADGKNPFFVGHFAG